MASKTISQEARRELIALLIVDDEPLVRNGIRHGLSALDDVEIVGECASGKEAISAIFRKA